MSTAPIIQALYCLTTLPASGLAALAMCARERGRIKLVERFGIWGALPNEFFWFHGASVGEINGLRPLLADPAIAALGLPRITSVVSTTALEVATPVSEQVHVLPFDNRLWYRVALGTARPKVFAFAETELWPELLQFLEHRAVPRILVNARVTERTFARYRRFQGLFRPHLERLNAVCAAEERSAEMFSTLGVPHERIEVTGNAKYDLAPPEVDTAMIRSRYFPTSRGIVTLGSIRPGEEDFWFPAIAALQHKDTANDIVVAPRHKEKFAYFADRLAEFGIPFQKWSEFSLDQWHARRLRVLLLDTFGQLLPFYAASSVAYVGATLVPIGGHNPLEVAMYGVPVAMGPHRQVVREVSDSLEMVGGLIGVRTVEDCAELLERVANGDAELEKAGMGARSIWKANRGATQRIVHRIEKVLAEVH